MAFKDIVPQEFFSQPPSNTHGTITIKAGQILVAWDKSCPIFNDNLTAARKVKATYGGSYRPGEGWLYALGVVNNVLATFPKTLVVSDEVKNLAKKAAPAKPIANSSPGSITVHGELFLVSWNNTADFGACLSGARGIKVAFPASPGWRKDLNGWLFVAEAAEMLVAVFPAFTRCAEVISAASKNVSPPEVGDDPFVLHLSKTADIVLERSDLPKIPFAHQKEAARFLITSTNRINDGIRCRGSILSDEMGLGKTYSAILAALIHKETNDSTKIIILSPKSLTGLWKRESAGIEVEVYSNHHRRFPEKVSGKFVVIVDEAHGFQNVKSARTKKLLGLVDNKECIGVYLLTGTPVKNGRPHNLLPLLKAINHGLTSSELKTKDYLWRYCEPKQIWTGKKAVGENEEVTEAGGMRVWTFNGAANLEELWDLTKGCILRRLKKDTISLPDFLRVVRGVDLTVAQENDYKALLSQMKGEYLDRVKTGKISGSGDVLVFLNHLRRAGSVAKVNTAISLGSEVLEEGGNPAIFTCFRESAGLIGKHFGVPVFSGDTSTCQRDKIVSDFQDKKTPVFVGLCGAGGFGITLTKANNVLLVDRPWTPGDALQVEQRLHRIGQGQKVTAHWLQHGQIDLTVDGILQKKTCNAEEILTGERRFLNFSEGDMAEQVVQDLGWN